ncbi:MAG: SDR family oxidoreductase [Candidatus Binatus sp.]|uniref:SDR family NAD(P)-dependent oxidoreductase n=1 Tax=Candidatus Binatus sp. TaxID=2811406 RepID=UPI0027277113|nr:glucose 1-dehydrogenase [Candidatus Binatus sp.]MDO8433919.1 SDR family oxidoreductase [Candidatus Binatus sp.]
MRLENKVALITGAGSGMGRAASVLFAREGAKIAAIDVNEASAAETAQMIKAAGGAAISLRADVSDSESARSMIDETVRTFGGIDVLYNNAGIEGESGFTAQLSEEAFDRVIAINLRGVWLGMKYALPKMIDRGGGAIINTASVAGLVGLKGAAAYCAAKAGVIALTRVAAIEYGRYNIRVNCICPGVIQTAMVERISGPAGMRPNFIQRASVFGRVGNADEIAHTALFLASDEAPFATGAPFIIDGGWVAS